MNSPRFSYIDSKSAPALQPLPSTNLVQLPASGLITVEAACTIYTCALSAAEVLPKFLFSHVHFITETAEHFPLFDGKFSLILFMVEVPVFLFVNSIKNGIKELGSFSGRYQLFQIRLKNPCLFRK